MRTFARLFVLVLGLTAATSVFYAVQQQKSLRVARTAAESLEKERTDLRNRLWEAERRRQELEARLAAAPTNEDGTLHVTTETGEFAVPGTGDGPRGGNGPRGGFGRALAAMDTPEAQRLVALQQKGALDATYSALFRNLNLTPAQLEQFKDLLVEKRTAASDVLAAARAQGLTGRESRDEIRVLMEATQLELDQSIRSLLGEAAYSQYRTYEQTQPQRQITGQLEQRLSYSSTPLTAQQSEQMVQILAATSGNSGRQPAAPAGNFVAARGGTAVFIGAGLGGATITDQAVQQAAAVLNPSQLQALQQLQQEQQAQAQLGQMMRQQFQPRRLAPGAVPPRG